MKDRCYNQKTPSYVSYGGRGIVVCDAWREDFARFYADLGPRPGLEFTLDREDNSGNYEPGNCRWATYRQQARNRRSNRFVVVAGERLCLAEAAERLGVNQRTFRKRILAGEGLA